VARDGEALETSKLETMVARDVRSYLADYRSGDRVEAERLRELCSTLARFFGELVAGHKAWSRFYWVDDIVPLSVQVNSGLQVVVDGLLIWGQEKQSHEWREPFVASLRIGGTGSVPLVYQITCGDADQGLGLNSYAKEELWMKTFPRTWLFMFVNGEI